MWAKYLMLILFGSVNVYGDSVYYSLASNFAGDSEFIYPGKMRSDDELGICEPNSVCGVVHTGFLSHVIVERWCKCPGKSCSWQWSSNYTQSISLGKNSQMKFCEPVSELPDCTKESSVSITIEKSADVNRPIKSNIKCKCPLNSTWTLIEHEEKDEQNKTIFENFVKNSFKCSKIKVCGEDEYCSHIRQNGIIINKCNCPRNYWCAHQYDPDPSLREPLIYETLRAESCLNMKGRPPKKT